MQEPLDGRGYFKCFFLVEYSHKDSFIPIHISHYI